MLVKYQRQINDDVWSEALIKIRLGEIDGNVINLLKSRLMCTSQGAVTELELQNDFQEATRLFARNDDCDTYNNQKLEELITNGNQHFYVEAEHTKTRPGALIAQSISIAELYEIAKLNRKNQLDDRDCAGIPREINLCVGARVMLRKNIDIGDGLVNGSIGTIHTISNIKHKLFSKMPAKIQIKFDNKDVGNLSVINQNRKCKANKITVGNETFILVDIEPTYGLFHASDKTTLIHRYNVPITVCYGMTVHKVQGLTLDKVVIQLDEKMNHEGSAYVALSRTRTLNNIILTKCELSSIKTNQESKQITINE